MPDHGVDPPPSRPRSRWRTAGRVTLWALAGMVLVVVLGLTLLQFDSVATRTMNILTGRFSPWSEASLTVSRASLRGIGRLSVTGLRLATSAGTDMVTIDSIRIHVRPLALVRGTLDIRSLQVVGAEAILRQRADSTFELLEPFISSVEEAAEDGPYRIQVGEGTITRSRIEARFLASPDSAHRLEGLEVGLREFVADHGLSVRLDTLGARLHSPGRLDSPAELSARLTIMDGVLSADHVLFTSDSSRVSARGTLVLPGAETPYLSDLDFRIAADPLDAGDLGGMIPSFATSGTLWFEGRVRGTSLLTEFEAQGRSSDGATFEAAGAFTPTTKDSISYRVDATLQDIQPDRWIVTAPIEGPVDAEVHLVLAGRHLDSLSGSAEIFLGAMVFGETSLAPTALRATLRQGAAQYTVTGGIVGLAEVRGTGSMRPFDPATVATLAAEVRQLGDTTIGSVRVAGVTGTVLATWAPASGMATVGGRLRAESGEATLNARANLTDDPPGWIIERLRVTELNLQELNADWPVSRIEASLRGSGRGWRPEDLAANSVVDLAASEIGSTRIDTATVDIRVQGGVVTLAGDARAPRGTATLAAVVRPFQDTVTFQVDSLRFRDLVLDTASTGPERPRLAGLLTAAGSLVPDTFPQISGSIDLDPATWNSARLEGGRLDFALAGAELAVDARLRTARGGVTFDGTAQLTRSDTSGIRIASGEGSGVVDLPDLGALLGRDTASAALNARFSLRADGADPLVTTWVADVSATGHYAAATLDTLRLDARLAGGVLRLDTLLLRSNLGTGDGSGVLALTEHATPPDSAALHIRFVADTGIGVSEVVSLGEYSIRGGILTVDATNADGGIDAQARLLALGLISDGPWADSLQIDGTARIERGRLDSLSATIGGSDVGYGTTHLNGLSGTVEHARGRSEFDITVVGDDQHRLRIAGTALPREQSITLAEMEVALMERSWTLVQPATVSYGPRLVVRNFTLQNGEQGVTVDGTLDRRGSQNLSVTFRNFPVQGFAEFAGYDGLDGELNGTVQLSGPARRVAVAGAMDLRLLGTTGSISLTPSGEDRLEVMGRLEDAAGRELIVEGTVPFVLSLAEGQPSPPAAGAAMALTIAADSFALGWLTPLLRPMGVEAMEGTLAADIRVTGTYGDPVMAGTAALTAGRIEYPRQGITYRNVAGEFTLDGPLITVTSLRATSEGTAVASGTIRMLDAGTPQLELEARFDEFRAAENEWGRFGVTGEVQITGELLAPVFTGAVQLVKSDIYADPVGQGGAGQAVTLTPEDFRMLRAYFGYRVDADAPTTAELLEAMALNLDVTLGGDTWLRRRTTPEMGIQLAGSIDVRKEAGDSIRVFGTIEVLPQRSYFEQFNRRFNVSSGTVTFNGPMMGWVANFQARYPVPSPGDASAPQVVITLNVQGGLENLNLTLGAEPAMETADVLSYLATGRPAANALAVDDIEDFGASLAAGQLAGVLEESAAEHVGLDVIEIRHNGIEGATVVAGRYVTPKLFVGFEQPLSLRSDGDEEGRIAEQSAAVRLEYSLYRWLLLHLQRGQSQFEFFLRFRRSF